MSLTEPKTISLVCLLSVVSCSSGVIEGRRDADDRQVSCTVASLQPSYEIGETPNLHVFIVNSGNEPMVLPGSLDASERRLRYPHAFFEVVGPAGGLQREPLVGCGWINDLRVENFMTMAPGARLDPYGDGFFPPAEMLHSRFTAAGDYTFTFHYSTLGSHVKDWQPSPLSSGSLRLPPPVLDRLKRVPRLTLECSVTVTVRP